MRALPAVAAAAALAAASPVPAAGHTVRRRSPFILAIDPGWPPVRVLTFQLLLLTLLHLPSTLGLQVWTAVLASSGVSLAGVVIKPLGRGGSLHFDQPRQASVVVSYLLHREWRFE